MLNYQSKYFLQSAPFKINFAGFESDTLKLQSNGWTLAVEDSFDHVFSRHSLRFILNHRMLKLYCLTDINEFEFQEFLVGISKDNFKMPFNIHVMAHDIQTMQIPAFDLTRIMEIDAIPRPIEIDYKNISDLNIFRTLVKPDNALIVEPDQISLLLEKIVACQSPKQAEIRERIRKADAREQLKQTLHAQILSVAA